MLTVDPASLKRFEHVVVGDASTPAGLAASYDEEDTREVMHVERLDPYTDVFSFWKAHQNSDQTSFRRPEPLRSNP